MEDLSSSMGHGLMIAWCTLHLAVSSLTNSCTVCQLSWTGSSSPNGTSHVYYSCGYVHDQRSWLSDTFLGAKAPSDKAKTPKWLSISTGLALLQDIEKYRALRKSHGKKKGGFYNALDSSGALVHYATDQVKRKDRV